MEQQVGTFHSNENESRIIIYREYFVKIQHAKKSLHEQVVIELSTLEALRTREVATLRVKDVDFERGDLQVLDSKKYRYFPIPLDPVMAQHLAAYIAENHLKPNDYVLQREHRSGERPQNVGQPLSNVAIYYTWKRLCRRLGITPMSPRIGRAYFACKWHYVDHKSIYGLMMVLRHSDILATQHYLAKILSYEDTKAEFNQGLKSPFAAECTRSKDCPLAVPDCRCKGFAPLISENKTTQSGEYEHTPTIEQPNTYAKETASIKRQT